MKNDKKDVGFIQDALFGLQNLIAAENHAIESYVQTKKDIWLKISRKLRVIRSKILYAITKENNAHAYCFIPSTRIITSEGFKDIFNIKVGEMVLTHKNRFREVTKVISHTHKGKIINLKTGYSNIPLIVTPNHLFYVADNVRVKQSTCWKKEDFKPGLLWKKAEDLTENDFLYLPRYNITQDIDKFNVSYKNNSKFNKWSGDITLNVDNDLMRLVGYYLSEGHHCERINKKGWKEGNVGFTFASKRESYAEFVKSYLRDTFGSNITPNQIGSVIQISTGKRLVREFFNQFGSHAHNKRIPSWIFKLESSKITSLIKSLFEGDASLGKYSIKYSSVSRDLAFGVRLLLNKLGIICNVSNRGKFKDSEIDGRIIKSNYDNYHVDISGDSARELARLCKFDYDGGKVTNGNHTYVNEDYILIPIKEINHSNYLGEVYNLEVKDDESYCTHSGIAHNCIGKHSLASAQALKELGNRYIEDGKMEQAKECFEDSATLEIMVLIINDYKGGDK